MPISSNPSSRKPAFLDHGQRIGETGHRNRHRRQSPAVAACRPRRAAPSAVRSIARRWQSAAPRYARPAQARPCAGARPSPIEFGGIDARHRGEIDRRARRQNVGQRRDFGLARPRGLDARTSRRTACGYRSRIFFRNCPKTGSTFPDRLLAPARDHEGFVVEPQPAVLLQHVARRLDVAPVAVDVGRAGRPRPAPRKSPRSTPRAASTCRSMTTLPTAACASRSGTASADRNRR